MLLVKVTADGGLQDEHFNYIMNNWFEPGKYPIGKMPIMMMYRLTSKTADGSTYLPSRASYYAHYNSQSDSDTPQGPLTYDIATVQNWIMSQLGNPVFNCASIPTRPNIASFGWGGDGYPNRFKRYDNQPNDDYGRYFPVYRLANRADSDITTIKVPSSANTPIDVTINRNVTVVDIMPGTYQYFTLQNTGDAYYESHYDQSGIIFKVGNQSDVVENVIGDLDLNVTFDTFLTNNGWTRDDLSPSTDSTKRFISDIYAINELDVFISPPTYDLGYFDPGETKYNMVQTVTFNSEKTYNGSKITKIVLDILTEAESTPATEDPAQTPRQKSGATETVVHATFYGKPYVTGQQLLWVKNFYNY